MFTSVCNWYAREEKCQKENDSINVSLKIHHLKLINFIAPSMKYNRDILRVKLCILSGIWKLEIRRVIISATHNILRSLKNLHLRKSPLYIITYRDPKSRLMLLSMNTWDFEGASRDEALNYWFSKVKLPLDTQRELCYSDYRIWHPWNEQCLNASPFKASLSCETV